MSDAEGNVYKTVKIGDQWWMAENLNVTKYRNGESIRQYKYSSDWQAASIGAYCEYEEGTVGKTPGKLYNWFAITDTNGIAPQGWHIPTDEDWKTLEKFLGMSASEADKSGWRGSNEGEKLKNTQGWVSYGEIWSTNESGFTAQAGNCRVPEGKYGQPSDLGSTGFWWTATASNSEAYYRYLDYKTKNVFRGYADKHYGFSIRCVKD